MISWGTVLDYSGIARYNVYRNGQLIGWSSAPTYVDAGLSIDGIYAYTVVAVDAAGNLGQPSAPVPIVFDDVPLIFAHYETLNYLSRKNVVGSTINPTLELNLENVSM